MDNISEREMDRIDEAYLNPQERAERVNAILQRDKEDVPSFIDITCFSVQWLASLAVGALSGDIDLVRIAKLANIWLYHRHYNDPEGIYGEPDREKKTEEKVVSEFDLID